MVLSDSEEKVPKIKGKYTKGWKLWKKKVPYGCFVCFLETSLPQSDLNQVNTSLINGDGNRQCTAAAKCNNLYETFIFLYGMSELWTKIFFVYSQNM